MHARTRIGTRILSIALAAALTALLAATGASPALAIDAGSRDDLIDGTVSALVYGNDHLATLPDSGTLVYEYRMEGDILPEPFVDDFKLAFSRIQDDEDADWTFTITMFTEGRTLTLPAMPATSVNPIFLVYFQRDANGMTANTGGSVHFFRNLLRTAMNRPGTAEPMTIEFDGEPVAAMRVTFMPFGGDGEGQRLKAFSQKLYSIVLSDAVPGQVYELQTTVPAADGSGITLRETYRFKELAP
jgi:hypothetical protein